ncbi:MAG: hypothetical protein AMXMBFR33_10950 [Candidatus Xenobia bacterium]
MAIGALVAGSLSLLPSQPREPLEPIQITLAAQAMDPRPALALRGTSEVADDGLSPGHVPATRWRTFGHTARNGVYFDRSGNWADTQTYVTADQYAAMPPAQQKHFLQRAGAQPEGVASGRPEQALIYPAVPGSFPGEPLDTQRSLGVEIDGARSFGHRPVAGQLFSGGRWKDTGGLVTADQASAMPEHQRAHLARSAGLSVSDLRVGFPERVVVRVDTSQDDPALARQLPSTIVRHRGFSMRADTALAFQRLERRLKETFPERQVVITSTMANRNPADRHGRGLAVDFVVLPLSLRESKIVERLSWESGMQPYNEYLYDSPQKTGPHMHVHLPD